MAQHTLKKIQKDGYDVQVESAIRDGVGHNIADHIGNTGNPHSVTKSQVGLGNVTNVASTSTIESGNNNNATSGGVYTALLAKMNTASSVTTGHLAEFSDGSNLSDSGYSATDLIAIAQGKVDSLTISYTSQGPGFVNESFNSNADVITLNSTDQIRGIATSGGVKDLVVGNMRNGDVIWIKETEVPDRWFLKETVQGQTTYKFYKLETQKIDVSGFVTKSSFTNAGDILVGTGNGTYTRLGVGTNGQVIRSNGSTLEWGTVAATDTWRNVKVNGTEVMGTATNTGAVNFANGTNTTVAYSNGTITIAATDTTYSVFNTTTSGLAPYVTGNTETTTASDYVLGSTGKWIAKGLISGFTSTDVTVEW